MGKISKALNKAKSERSSAKVSTSTPMKEKKKPVDEVLSKLSSQKHESRAKHSGVRRRKYDKKRAFLYSLPVVVVAIVIGHLYSSSVSDPLSKVKKKAPVEKEMVEVKERQEVVPEKALSVIDAPQEEAVKTEVPKEVVTTSVESQNISFDLDRDMKVVSMRQASGVVAQSNFPTDIDLQPLADFDSSRRINLVGGSFKTWGAGTFGVVNIQDFFDAQNARFGKGRSLKIEYNIAESSRLSEAGFKMDLSALPVAKYDYFVFYLKGDSFIGYSKKLQVTLVGEKTLQTFNLNNVKDSWDKVEIPLVQFKQDNKEIKEFQIRLSNDYLDRNAGAYYLDDVYMY